MFSLHHPPTIVRTTSTTTTTHQADGDTITCSNSDTYDVWCDDTTTTCIRAAHGITLRCEYALFLSKHTHAYTPPPSPNNSLLFRAFSFICIVSFMCQCVLLICFWFAICLSRVLPNPTPPLLYLPCAACKLHSWTCACASLRGSPWTIISSSSCMHMHDVVRYDLRCHACIVYMCSCYYSSLSARSLHVLSLPKTSQTHIHIHIVTHIHIWIETST